MGKEPPQIPDGPLRHQWDYEGNPGELEALAEELLYAAEYEHLEQESLF